MTDLKREILDIFHQDLRRVAQCIKQEQIAHQEKARRTNRAASEVKHRIREEIIRRASSSELQSQLLVLEYCFSVASLEYRHAVWPYEYMALSRRVGELWQGFCAVCWECPSRDGVRRIDPPAFSSIMDTVRARITEQLKGTQHCIELGIDFENLLELVGEINMVEDEVFTVGPTPHVVDFKSGFGSNEKGNMLRLLAVGRAYRLWNPQTRLMLIVRQDKNNNYLQVLRRTKLWEVWCGQQAYAAIEELTGAKINTVRKEVVDFRADLSNQFLSDMSGHLTDLTEYLKW